MKIRLRPYQAIYIFFILLFLFLFWLLFRFPPDLIVSFVGRFGPLAPLVYTLVLSSTMIFAPLSGSPVFLAGYILFKENVKTYEYFSVLIAAVIDFWIARLWGRRLVVRLMGSENLDKLDIITKNYGIKSLIFLRLFQFQLADFISYAYGLTNIRFLPYITVTVLAPIPWLIIWRLFLFRYIDSFADFSLLFLLTLLPFILLSAYLWQQKNPRHRPDK